MLLFQREFRGHASTAGLLVLRSEAALSFLPCIAPCSAKPATQGEAEGYAEQGRHFAE